MTDLDKLNAYLSGDYDLTKDELQMIMTDYEIDCPYMDDWISHGYSSFDEWAKVNNVALTYLAELKEAIELARKKMDEEK